MSTVGQPQIEPSWKQEVNRRLAAHKNRKAASAEPAPAQPNKSPNSRAAETAARVAARYAKAPTYSQMQAEEARLAVRAAEIATQVALQAQAAAEDALAELHAATVEVPARGPAVVESIERARKPEPEIEPEAELELEPVVFIEQEPMEVLTVESSSLPFEPVILVAEPEQIEPAFIADPDLQKNLAVRWDPDLPVLSKERKVAPPSQEPFELAAEDWWTPSEVSATLHHEPLEVADSQPGHANLIEFPRELVATRKMRPRLAEPEMPGSAEVQLSIFEVDPHAVATEPEPMEAEETPAARYSGAEWSGMELDSHPAARETVAADTAREKDGPYLAPLGLRLMAGVVDSALILGAFFLSAMVAASHTTQPLLPKTVEVLAVVSLFLTGLLYHALFFSMGAPTPGMRYAGIALCTFENDVPSRAQLRRRMLAMLVSLLPLGLGMVWSVFDDDHLSWHDRISQTYLRKR